MKTQKMNCKINVRHILCILFVHIITTEAFQPYRIADINPKCEHVSTLLCMPATSDSVTKLSSNSRQRRSAAGQHKTNHINNYEKSRKKRRTTSDVIEWRYNTTTFPNFANDVTSDDVIESLRKLHPMIATECSKFVKLFLCSVYSPVCTKFGVVPPCRELCHKVASDCARTIKEFGIEWPESIQCDFFPSYQSDDDVLANEVTFIGGVTSQDDDYAIVIQRSARLTWMEAFAADGKICIPPSEDDVITPQLELLAKNIHLRPTKKNVSSYSQTNHQFGVWCPAEMRSPPGQSGYSFLGMENCSPPCPNMYLSDGELLSVRYLIIFMSSLCIIVTFFTLCTFLIDTKRFRYPERPIVFYALSYFIVSVIFLAGFILKEDAACNDEIRDEETNDIVQGFTVVKGDHKQSCTILFMILYYFTVNGTIWWLILTITWLLAAGFKWGSEAIEKYSIYYHAFAWGIPAVQTMIVVTFSKIEGDNISGVCFLGLYDSGGLRYLLLTPLCIYLFVGITILCTGFACLNRVRRKLGNDEVNKKKLSKFMTRIGVFSVMYIVPQVILFSIYIFEDSYRTRWEATWFLKACDDYRVPCPAADSNITVTAGEGDDQPHVMLFIAKYFMTLIVALPPLFWVASKKTLVSWRLFFVREKTISHTHIVRQNNNHNNYRHQNSSKKALLRDGSMGANNHREETRRPRSLGDGGLENDDVFVGLETATKLHGSSASVAARAKAVAEGQNSRHNSILHHQLQHERSQNLPPPPPDLPTLANDLSVRRKTQYKKEFPERRKQNRTASTASTSSRGVTSSVHKHASSLSSLSAHRTQSQSSINIKHASSLDKNEFKEHLAQKLPILSQATPSRPDTASSVPSDSKPKPPPKSSAVLAMAKAKLENENTVKP